MQLQGARSRFEAQGIKLAAISYDSPAILKEFADRHKIQFPLLADPQSRIIASYGVFNPDAAGMMKGMALPGYFHIDANGIVREEYFGAKYTDRFTANHVMAKLFPELAEEASRKLEAPHIGLELAQTDRVVAPGNRFSLVVQVKLPQDVHVYAPGVKGYKPIELELDRSSDFEFKVPAYPASQILYLEAIKEQVSVFEGTFRIVAEGAVSANPEFLKSLGPNGKNITATGKLHYQACDRTTCFVPASVPVSWQLEVLALDLQRSPEAIQHK